MKKILLSLGVVASFTAPVVLAVSCGNDSDTTTDDKKTVSNQEGTITLKYEGTTVTSIEVNNFQGDLNQMMLEVMTLATSKNITPEAGVNPITLVHVTGNDNLAHAVQAEVESLSHPVPPVVQNAPVQETPDTTTQTDGTTNVQPAPVQETPDSTTQTTDSDQDLVDAELISSIPQNVLSSNDFMVNGVQIANDSEITSDFATKIGLTMKSGFVYKITDINLPIGDPEQKQIAEFKIIISKNGANATTQLLTTTLTNNNPATAHYIGAKMDAMVKTMDHTFFDWVITNWDNVSEVIGGSFDPNTTDDVTPEVGDGKIVSTINNNVATLYIALPTSFGTADGDVLSQVEATVNALEGNHTGLGAGPIALGPKWTFGTATAQQKKFTFTIQNTPTSWKQGMDNSSNNTRIVATFSVSTAVSQYANGWWDAGIFDAGTTQNAPLFEAIKAIKN